MAHGAGSMTERPVGSGNWRLRAYAGRNPLTDSPIQVTRTFRGTEPAARKALAKLVTEVESGQFDRTRVTVGELLDRWLEHIEANGKARPTTMQGYRSRIEHRIRPALGKVKLTKLDPATLDAWYRRWLGEGLSASTVHGHHAILSAACRQAVKWGWIDRAPTDRASAPTPRPAKMRVPTPTQLTALVNAAEKRDPVLAAAIALAALTGGRRGELVALRWSDVDLAVGTVRIARSISVVAGERIEGPTKTHQVRQIALDEVAVEMLRRHWAFVRDRSELVESPLVEDPFVLSYQAHSGTPVGGDTLSHNFTALCAAVERAEATAKGGKLPASERYGYHFHELRHFSVTTLLAAGVDVRTVSERHGHATATQTLNRYAHALPERDRAAAAVLGRVLTPR